MQRFLARFKGLSVLSKQALLIACGAICCFLLYTQTNHSKLHNIDVPKITTQIKWNDVVGLSDAKQALKEAVILPKKYPNLFRGHRRPWRGILLYGPPGTGKSLLAKAAATEARCTFFSVSAATLASEFYGAGEKKVRELFTKARKQKPSIIFLDEIDSMCMRRTNTSVHEATKRIQTELLVQMEGVGYDQNDVLVLGATNMVWTLDPAFKRRFQKQIYVGPPKKLSDRKEMLKFYLDTEEHSLAEEDFTKLAKTLVGYTGSDIKAVVQNALMLPLRRAQEATWFVPVHEKKPRLYEPCLKNQEGAICTTFEEIAAKIWIQPISVADIQQSLQQVHPSIPKSEWKRYYGIDEECD